MKTLGFLFFLSLFTLSSPAVLAQDGTEEAWNGNRIPEPSLSDYQVAQRTPGLSDPYDVVSLEGESVRTPPGALEPNSLK